MHGRVPAACALTLELLAAADADHVHGGSPLDRNNLAIATAKLTR